MLLTATARKEKRIGTVENVENAHAKKLDKSMRLCERKGGQHLEYKGKTSLRLLPSIGRFKSQVSVKSMGPIWIFDDLVAFAGS